MDLCPLQLFTWLLVIAVRWVFFRVLCCLCHSIGTFNPSGTMDKLLLILPLYLVVAVMLHFLQNEDIRLTNATRIILTQSNPIIVHIHRARFDDMLLLLLLLLPFCAKPYQLGIDGYSNYLKIFESDFDFRPCWKCSVRSTTKSVCRERNYDFSTQIQYTTVVSIQKWVSFTRWWIKSQPRYRVQRGGTHNANKRTNSSTMCKPTCRIYAFIWNRCIPARWMLYGLRFEFEVSCRKRKQIQIRFELWRNCHIGAAMHLIVISIYQPHISIQPQPPFEKGTQSHLQSFGKDKKFLISAGVTYAN